MEFRLVTMKDTPMKDSETADSTAIHSPTPGLKARGSATGASAIRRSSSFTSSSSPWIRRNSLLSQSMIQNENISVYDSPSFYSDSSYNIISLKECQGFIFNQDLFALPYQQLRSLANERKIRTLARRSVTRKSSVTPTSCSPDPQDSAQQSLGPLGTQPPRRYTSYHAPRPSFMDTDEKSEPADEIAVADEYDEYEDDDFQEMNEYPGDSFNRRYKVHVTEIVVDEKDSDIFPS